MKYLASFLLGVVVAVWLYPPQPTVQLSAYDREKIVWEMLDILEEQGYNINQAKLSLTQPKKWWQF